MDAGAVSASPIELDVFADLACPWCFIAHRRLGRAIERSAGDGVEPGSAFRWRAFQLEPDLPAEGADAIDYYDRMLGGPRGRLAAWQMFTEIGAEDGIRFAFERQERTPNTSLAHRLVALAADAPGAWPTDASSWGRPVGWDGPPGPTRRSTVDADQRTLAGLLFSALFEDGVDIGDAAATLEYLRWHGVEFDVTALRRALAAGAGRDRVREDAGIASAIGIGAVPVVIANGRHAVWGAQPEVVFRRLLVVAGRDADGPPPVRVPRLRTPAPDSFAPRCSFVTSGRSGGPENGDGRPRG